MEILKVQNLTLTLDGRKILDNLTMSITAGKIHAIVGPNGAGKSSLAYAVMGLEGYRDIEGDIIFEGESIKGLSIDERARRGITLAWQEPARFEGLSVGQFILAAAKEKSADAVKQALERVGLSSEYINRAVDKTLSGGERKKIELASILAMRPKLVMLDEPDSGIDVMSLENIFGAIKYLKQQGATVLLITHSPVVMEHAEHAFLMCRGEILEDGPMEKLLPYFKQQCLPCRHKNQPELNGEFPI